MTISNHRVYKVRGSLIYLNVDESLENKKRSQGVFEPEKYQAIKHFLSVGSNMVDIGSGNGGFSLWASTLVGPTGKVISYESSIDKVKWLKKSISVNNYMNIILREKHLTNNKIYSTLDSDLSKNNINKVDLIKVNANGLEFEILDGSRNTIKRNKNIVLLVDLNSETSTIKLKNLLEDLNLECFKIKSSFKRKINDISKVKSFIAKRKG